MEIFHAVSRNICGGAGDAEKSTIMSRYNFFENLHYSGILSKIILFVTQLFLSPAPRSHNHFRR
jgi:hypothetical protein